MPKEISVHTGEKVPLSGQYRPSGGNTEATFTEGNRVPPNKEGARQIWFLVDETKHKKR